MTPIYPSPPPMIVVSASGGSSATNAPPPFSQMLERLNLLARGEKVDSGLQVRPYNHQSQTEHYPPAIDYDAAEFALRQYIGSQGDDFDKLAIQAGRHFGSPHLRPGGTPVTDDAIRRLVDDDEEWLGDELS